MGEDLKNYYQNYINTIFADDEYSFCTYIILKNTSELREFTLFEGDPIKDKNNIKYNLKKKIQNIISDTIISTFTNPDAEFESSDYIADNQDKFYIISQDSDYCPFKISNIKTNIQKYSDHDRIQADGILFRFEKEDKVIWAYQNFSPISIPNTKNNFINLINKNNIFDELKEPIIAINNKVDLLIIDNKIITKNLKLLERSFGLERYIRSKANSIISEIESLQIVSDIKKIEQYIGRNKLSYSKKLLRIKRSKVLTTDKENLYNKITSLPRWKDKFQLDSKTHKIILNTYSNVESLIDLLDERYTRSDVTDEEYDTSAKKWIPHI